MGKVFESNGKNYLVVKVPDIVLAVTERTELLELPFGNEYVRFYDSGHHLLHSIELDKPTGSYSIVGVVKDLTLEQKGKIYPYALESVLGFKTCMHIHEGVNLTDNDLILEIHDLL